MTYLRSGGSCRACVRNHWALGLAFGCTGGRGRTCFCSVLETKCLSVGSPIRRETLWSHVGQLLILLTGTNPHQFCGLSCRRDFSTPRGRLLCIRQPRLIRAGPIQPRGDIRARTENRLVANEVRYQLRHTPRCPPRRAQCDQTLCNEAGHDRNTPRRVVSRTVVPPILRSDFAQAFACPH